MKKKILFAVCSVVFFSVAALGQNKRTFTKETTFLLEVSRLVHVDAYLRDPFYIEISNKVNYHNGVYIIGNDIGSLLNYGWNQTINYSDSLEFKREFITNRNLDTLRVGTFKYKKIPMKVRYHYLGHYTIPIPQFSYLGGVQKYKMERTKVYIITDILD
jgi:hypothetical protein